MSFQFQGDATQFIATSNNILRKQGIEVTYGSDFSVYRSVLTNERPQQRLGSPFNPAIHDLNDENAFWVLGRNAEGTLIHSQAFKLVDLAGGNLSKFMRQNFRSFPPPLADIDFKRSRYRATPGAHRMFGRTVYHGEIWLAPEPGLYRGVGLSTVLVRTGMLEALRRWQPEWMYGFVIRKLAFGGFCERMGYMRAEPGALNWYRKGSDTPLEAFMVSMSRDDLVYLLDMPVDDVIPLAA